METTIVERMRFVGKNGEFDFFDILLGVGLMKDKWYEIEIKIKEVDGG